MTLAVEENQAAGSTPAGGEQADTLLGDTPGAIGRGGGISRGSAQEVHGRFGKDNFHDGFAVPGAGDAAGFSVGIATAADERRIADTAGKFAAGAAGGSAGEEAALAIESDGADGAVLVAAVVGGGMFVAAAFLPGFALGGGDESGGVAQGDAVFAGVALGALGDEHHVRPVFEESARETDGIADTLDGGDGAGAERSAVHHDGVAFHAAIEVEMGTGAGVEDRGVFEDDDGGFHGIEGGAAASQNGPAGFEGAAAAILAGFDGVVGDIPGAAVDDERRLHPAKVRERDRMQDDASDEEIEQEENRAGEKEKRGAMDANAAGRLERGEETPGDKLKARVLAQAEAGAGDGMARKAAAKGAVFIARPEVQEAALAPKNGCAEHEQQIAQNSQQAERRTRTPIHKALIGGPTHDTVRTESSAKRLQRAFKLLREW